MLNFCKGGVWMLTMYFGDGYGTVSSRRIDFDDYLIGGDQFSLIPIDAAMNPQTGKGPTLF